MSEVATKTLPVEPPEEDEGEEAQACTEAGQAWRRCEDRGGTDGERV